MTTLVFGATGTVGAATLQALAARDAAAIAFVRVPARARDRLGDRVEVTIGDLDDPSTIRPALVGIDRVLLCSGHDPAMRTQQLAVLERGRHQRRPARGEDGPDGTEGGRWRAAPSLLCTANDYHRIVLVYERRPTALASSSLG